MKSRNENLAAFSLSIPKNNAEEIVTPLLLIPGKIAAICAIPIARAFLLFNFENCFEFLVDNNINPVMIKAVPKKRYESNKPVKKLEK